MKYREYVTLVCGAVMLGIMLWSAIAAADETVHVGGSNAVLLRPSSPSASVILMPGGSGSINLGANGEINSATGNQLVRTRNAYLSRGLAVLIVDAGVDLASAVEYMAQIKRPVTIVATSRGTIRAAEGISRGARPDSLVLTSGILTRYSGNIPNVASILGSPDALPRTLVIHHRNDGCRVTRPAGVAPFIQWAAGKASVVWLSGGVKSGNPCKSQSHHGFNGIDSQVVSLAAGFH